MTDAADHMTQTLLAALVEIERAAPGLSLSQLAMFLHVRHQEGVRMLELSSLCGRNDAAVSRGVRAMAVEGEPGSLAPAYGLVELLRGTDGRSRHLALTAAGNALADRLNFIFAAEPKADGSPNTSNMASTMGECSSPAQSRGQLRSGAGARGA
jgi:DNA-binding MarR family transcriptional regulator